MSLSLWLRRALLSAATLGLLATVGGPGCIKKAPSAVVVRLSSNMAWPGSVTDGSADLSSIEISGKRDGNDIGPYYFGAKDRLPFDPAFGPTTPPFLATLTFFNNPDQDRPDSMPLALTIVATGTKNNKPFTVTKLATFGFPSEETRLLDLRLEAECADISPEDLCIGSSTPQTCKAGGCESVSHDIDSFPSYPPPVFDNSGDTCFDASLSGCFGSAVSLPLSLKKLGKGSPCTFIPRNLTGIDIGKNAPNLNVAFTWKATGNRYLVIDRETNTGNDPKYGWQLQQVKDDLNPLPDAPSIPGIVIASDLCSQLISKDANGNPNGLDIVIANGNGSACASKTRSQRLCADPTLKPADTSIATKLSTYSRSAWRAPG